jgi:hypothetical protein
LSTVGQKQPHKTRLIFHEQEPLPAVVRGR